MAPFDPAWIVLELSQDNNPRASWSASDGRQIPDVGLDLTIKCVRFPDTSTGCTAGQPLEYHLDSVNGRTAQVSADPTFDGAACTSAVFQRSLRKIVADGYYCVETAAYWIGIDPDNLPAASSAIKVTLIVTLWPR